LDCRTSTGAAADENEKMTETKNRRPLTSRNTGWAQGITRALAKTPITPNQVSAFSVMAALLAGLWFAAVAWTDGWGQVAVLLAAGLAILVAYLRAFGGSLGQDADYSGPMAKQHRMAAITLAAALGIVLSPWIAPGTVLAFALWVIVLGCIATVARRGMRIHERLAKSG
tara:strand:- start:450 stop:959 length:510 start_codon:yes stop_codon:yes gene_type:complete